MTISKSLSVDLSPNRNSWYLEKLPWSAFVEYQFETLLPSSFSSGVEMYFWFELSVAMQAGASLRFFRKKNKKPDALASLVIGRFENSWNSTACHRIPQPLILVLNFIFPILERL